MKKNLQKELTKALKEGSAEMLGHMAKDSARNKKELTKDEAGKMLRNIYMAFLDTNDRESLAASLEREGVSSDKINAAWAAINKLSDEFDSIKQENKNMSLKDMIKEELEKALGEINMPFKVAMEIKNLDDNISRLMAQRDSLAREHGEQPRYAKMVRDMGGLTREGEGAPVSVPVGSRHRAKRLYRLGYEDGLRGQLPNNLKLRDNEHYKAGNEEGEKERAAGRGYGD